MKKIVFFVQWMLCGGVENALISLSTKLVDMGNEVTIYVIRKKGDFINKVPKTIQLLEIPMDNQLRNRIPVGGTKVTIRECLEKKEYLNVIKFSIKHKLGKTPFAELNIRLDQIPDLKEKYDIAVNFHMHSPFLVWYLSERVLADKKFTWIHNDFTTTKYEVQLLKKYLNGVDRFFAVSQKLKDEFLEAVPEYTSKTEVALNIVPVAKIVEKSDAFFPDEYKLSNNNTLKILTVGRLEEQKGYDLAVEVCRNLKENGFNFNWYVLGEGTLRNDLIKSIKRNNIEDCFFILGNKMNPYPYFKYCDIYVQTSRHEGYVTTVTEAKLFNKPIITTDVSGAREQIKDGINGEISLISADDITSRLKKLMENPKIREQYSVKLSELKENGIGSWINWFK